MEFRHRIAVISANGDRLTHCAPRMASLLIESGRAIVAECKRVKTAAGHTKQVAAVKLTEQRAKMSELDIWPGSYGIDRVHSEYGIYFQHRNPREEALPAIS